MKRVGIRIVLLLCFAPGSAAWAVEPAYREIQASFTYGVSVPTGDWELLMDTGRCLGIDVAMSVSSRATVGFHGGLGGFAPMFERIGPQSVATSGDWLRIVGGAFGEYRLTRSPLAPFVGTSLGLQAVHINYADTSVGFEGQGGYGWGFGFAAGLQYRNSDRFGGVLRFSVETSPDLEDGWFVQTELGLRVFL